MRNLKIHGFSFGKITMSLISILGLFMGSLWGSPTSKAWDLLLKNKPGQAEKEFKKTTKHKNKDIAAEAFRGLSEVANYQGDFNLEVEYFLKGFEKDNKEIHLGAGAKKLMMVGRSPQGFKYKNTKKIMTRVAKNKGLFSGEFKELLIQRYLNDGKLKLAQKFSRELNPISTWKMIGPFDNTSGAGFNEVYPPEKEIKFSATYKGKDANLTRWHTLNNKSPLGWIFMDNRSQAYNAINYFYTNIKSSRDQNVILAFGASGTFKIFLNGKLILADSNYRNTGADSFCQRVKLKKGNNPVLLKLGHETGNRLISAPPRSNFLMRIVDENYVKASGLEFIPAPEISVKYKGKVKNLLPSPKVEKVEAVMQKRLKKNPEDIDALLMLVRYYNVLELTDKSQKLVKSYIKKYPESAVLRVLSHENLVRSKKQINSQLELKKAYQFDPTHYYAWKSEFGKKVSEGNAKNILKFIESSPEKYREDSEAILAKMGAKMKLGYENEALSYLTVLEKNYSDNPSVVDLLVKWYFEQGKVKQAEKLIKNYLKHDKPNLSFYKILAELRLKNGKFKKAVKLYQENAKYNSSDPNVYYYIAGLYYLNKDYQKALKYIKLTEEIIPTSSNVLNLKVGILESMGKKDQAIKTSRDIIDYTSSDFIAWDKIRSLKQLPAILSMAPLPDADSLIKLTKNWTHIKYDKGVILSLINDVFYYPSRCSSKRTFALIYLPTQAAIDLWKERSIGYNGYYQSLIIDRAVSIKADGSEIAADKNNNEIVFKSLEPGDFVLFEYTLQNYYSGEMASHVYGVQSFSLNYPTYSNQVRLVTPIKDTIQYTLRGDSIRFSSKKIKDYVVKTFTRDPYKEYPSETFADYQSKVNQVVQYSTFKNWDQIRKWYHGLTDTKQNKSLELRALADSLTKGISSDEEKIHRIHDYITRNIRYSYVSFRQSGWIPQWAHDVVSTKIGDCKDMASLGKTLMDLAGIPSDLVLVNTNKKHFIDHEFIGPNFNHCILKCTLKGKDHYIDFTDNNMSMYTIPRSDQGAMSLIVGKKGSQIQTLPYDPVNRRVKKRTVNTHIDQEGNFVREVSTLRTGVFAGSLRSTYRFLSPEKRYQTMHKTLSSSFPDITLDSLTFDKLDDLSDSLNYQYKYTAKNAVSLAGNNAILTLNLPDKISNSSFPVEENRIYPVDMDNAWFDISKLECEGEITYPANWKPLNLPDKVNYKSEYGEYFLEFKNKGKKITFKRWSNFNMNKTYSLKDYPELTGFLKKVAKADDIRLLFSIN